MTSAPMSLVWVVDIIGSSLMIVLSLYAVKLMREIYIKKRDISLYSYLYAQTIALAIFALSRSVGHIVKRILITAGYPEVWEILSPVSGSINSLTFVGFGLIALLYSNVRATSEKVDALEKKERELRESEEKYRTLVEDIPDMIYSLNDKGEFISINTTGLNLLGYSKEEIIGAHFSRVVFKEDHDKASKSFKELLDHKKETTRGLELRLQTKKGDIIFAELNTRGRYGEDGRLIRAEGVVRDITERKRGEEQILRQSAVLDAINRMFQETMRCETDEEVARMCLAVAEELTGSKFGFIGEVNESGRFDVIALSDPGWEACRMPKSNAVIMIKDMEVRGIWARVLKDGRPLIVNDPASHPDRVGIPEGHPPLTSFLGVPLKREGKTTGMIALANKEGGYDLADQEDIETLSAAFLEALIRKRAEEEVKNRMEDLKIINSIIRDVSSTIDLEEVLHRITKSAAELINGDAATIAVFDEEKGVVTYPYHYNMPEELKEVVARRGQGLAGQVIETKKPVIIEEYPSHPKAVKEFVDAGLKVLCAVPLISKGKAFGALGVFGLTKEKRFSKHDLELLETVGKEAAVAIENARLYQEIKGFSETLEKKVKERTAELEEAQEALVILLEDVNQAKEELEEANIQLQELDRLKSMFIASMSHELRTPLNSIIGFTGIILQGMTGEITEEQRKQLTMVKNSANHLLSLINDIIDLSKIEAGKVELAIEEFDLSGLVQEVKDSFTVAVAEKGLKMPLKMPDRLVIESDERRVKQVLVNFVGNAVKFTDEGEIEIKVVKKDGMVEVSVRDTGIGIRKEDMDRLFKPFSQVPAEDRSKEGTGLGLYLSKKIAELLGGEIKAESEFGKGSVFTFTLPLKYREVKT